MTDVADHLDRLFAGRPDKLTPTEAADILGITVQGVYGWLRDGIVPAYKLGKTWIILRDELEETVRAGANRPGRRSRADTPGTAEPGTPDEGAAGTDTAGPGTPGGDTTGADPAGAACGGDEQQGGGGPAGKE